MFKKLTAVLIAAVMVVTLFSGVAGAAVRPGFSNSKVGGKLILSSFSDAVTLTPLRASDQASIDIQGMIFDSLMDANYAGKEIPGLAERYEYDPKTLTYTFYLRKGLKWHDGKPVTAKDVKFSMDMYTHPDTLNVYATDFVDIKSTTVVNDLTVKIQLKKKNVFFLTTGPGGIGWIMPAHHFPRGILDYNADNTKFSRNPIGTGPFKMKEWKSDERTVLTANLNYYAGRPYMDEVITRILPDANVEAINLLKGDIDFVQVLAPRTIADVEKDKDLRSVIYDRGNFAYIGWNNDNPIYKDKRVRQAMNYAMDRQAVVDKINLGRGYVASGPMHPKIPQQNSAVKPYPLDLKKAADLLAEAGWKKGSDGILEKDGKDFTVEIAYNSGNVTRPRIAAILAQNLKKLGIKATTRAYEWSIYLDKYARGELDMFVLGWTGYGTNVEHRGFFHSEAIPNNEGEGGSNRMRIRYDKVDQILETYVAEDDANKRNKLYQEMHQFLHDEAVMIFTHHARSTAGMDKNLMGVRISLSSTYWNIEDWYWKK